MLILAKNYISGEDTRENILRYRCCAFEEPVDEKLPVSVASDKFFKKRRRDSIVKKPMIDKKKTVSLNVIMILQLICRTHS